MNLETFLIQAKIRIDKNTDCDCDHFHFDLLTKSLLRIKMFHIELDFISGQKLLISS